MLQGEGGRLQRVGGEVVGGCAGLTCWEKTSTERLVNLYLFAHGLLWRRGREVRHPGGEYWSGGHRP